MIRIRVATLTLRGRVALRKGHVPKVRGRIAQAFFKLFITGGMANPIAQHVHEYVTQERSRTCLISFKSLPKDAPYREGWGTPGRPP